MKSAAAPRRIQGIYRIVHIESGRMYIGRTVDYVRRQRAHVWHLERGKHQNPKLQRAWDKYGAEAFRFDFLEAVTREDLIVREQAYLDELQPFYNVALNAANPVLGPVKTHCPAGHPYEGENRRITRDGGVKCRTCNAVNARRRHHEKRAAAGHAVAIWTGLRTECAKGHPYDEENTGHTPNGWRYCKQCNRDRTYTLFVAKVAAEGREIGPKPGTQTHCPHGHEYTLENTRLDQRGYRHCRTCKTKSRRVSHCPQGHEYSPDNTVLDKRGCRDCLTCKKGGAAAYHARQVAAAQVRPRPQQRTHCPQGHEYSGDNLIRKKNGSRGCRQCKQDRRAAVVEAQKVAGTYKPRGWGLQEFRAKRKAEQQ